MMSINENINFHIRFHAFFLPAGDTVVSAGRKVESICLKIEGRVRSAGAGNFEAYIQEISV